MRTLPICLVTVALFSTACFEESGATEVGTGTETGDGDGDPGDGESGDGDGDGDSGDVCGDGVVAGDEECDLGSANSDQGECTSACTTAVCGDGLVHASVESCDDSGESATCNDDCTLAACGDGKINSKAGETCEGDGSVNNGECMDCALACAPNYDDCNASSADGCEIYLCWGGSCDNPQLQPGTEEFEYTGDLQMFEVPACVETLTIEAFGAAGGAGTNPAYPGGLGARMKGDFTVEDGETLVLLVGGVGLDSTDGTTQGGGSGGGGSFLVDSMMMPLLVAGGGGGASYVNNQGEVSAPGGDGVTSQIGVAGDGGNAGVGGTDGNGGGSTDWGGWHGGTGGGGFFTAGLAPSNGDVEQYGSPNLPGQAFVDGGAGGLGGDMGGRNGGFGGGGSAGFTGGGGGGYSGGGAGGITAELNSGGGGGSINLGSNQDNQAGNNQGNGKIVVSW